MRVLLSTYGSRGDVQPLAALAVQLQALGLDAVVSAPPDQEFVTLLAEQGVPLAPAFTSVRQWIAERTADAGRDLPKLAAEMVQRQYAAIAEAAQAGCDAIVATGLMPSVGAAQMVAETQDVPFFHVSFCPLFLPSPHFPPYAYPGHPHPQEVTDNQTLWNLNIQTLNMLFGPGINGHRATLGLPQVSNVRDHIYSERPLLAADPVLSPWLTPAPLDVLQTGAWLIEDARPLPRELLAFLDAGPPPVCVGFGSLPTHDPKAVATIATDAIRAHGRRLIVAQGWAGLSLIDGRDDAFAIGEVNQQALFPKVAAVIHHGGAGTTTTAALAGAPQVIVPQIVDQPYWASRVANLGIGVAHDGPLPTPRSLFEALSLALAPQTRERAAAIAPTIRTDGAAIAARLILEAIDR